MPALASAPPEPLTSVVITTLNARLTVRDCIDSVLAAGGSVGEVIVVDRGSTDGTRDIARRVGSPVRVLERPGLSERDAVVAGLAEAVSPRAGVVPSRTVVAPGALAAGEVQLRPVGTTAFGRAVAAMAGDDVPTITVAGATGPAPARPSWYFVAGAATELAAEAFRRPAPAPGALVGAAVGLAVFGRGWLRVALPLGHAVLTAVRAVRAGGDPGVAPHRAFLAGEIRDWAAGAGWWASRRAR